MHEDQDEPFRAIITSVEDDDAYTPDAAVTEQDVDRWNKEWLDYLGREWRKQLMPHTELPHKPELPNDPLAMLDVITGPRAPLSIYCDREWLEDKAVMELGCGCGFLGKQLGRYVDSYLGVDFSTMALQIARLVSPENCTYVAASDATALDRHHGKIDTAVGRYFWIHQNFVMARRNLDLLEACVKPGGRIYADFFWPDPAREYYVVLPPTAPMSKTFPSAMFRYRSEDVRALIEGRPLKIVRETISTEMERRYVVLERL